MVIWLSDYLALGDSITAGYGVESLLSFPTIYAAFLRRHNPTLHMRNCGVNGLSTGGFLDLLRTNDNLRHSVSQASLITLTIGSNDLLHLIGKTKQTISTSELMHALNTMSNNFVQFGGELRRLNPSATVKVATLYNPLPAGPYARYSEQVQGVLNNANAMIVSWARRYVSIPIYIDREFRGKEQLLIGRDYVHPNAAGYQVIAKAFAHY